MSRGVTFVVDGFANTSIFAVRVDGQGDELEVITTDKLGDGMMASPTAVDETLYLRTKRHLYRVREEE